MLLGVKSNLGLFQMTRKKRKTWLGTISGTLSHWSGDIFKNGCRELSEPGWWALISNRLPADLISDGEYDFKVRSKIFCWKKS